MAERQLPKLNVAGSIPVSRSKNNGLISAVANRARFSSKTFRSIFPAAIPSDAYRRPAGESPLDVWL